MRSLVFCICILLTAALQAQIPSYGSANKLDVACWNIKWFGDLNNGPSDETKQFNSVLKVIRETKIDVWGLSEISNNDTFNRLMDSLPQYAGIIAPINQSQKTAFIYDTSIFKLIHSKLVLTNESYDFASGRFPFEVALLSKLGNQEDTLFFLTLHLKANVGNAAAKQQSWLRRQNAAGHLKTYIDQNLSDKKVIVLGDFNDDTDTSIYSPNPTPFKNLLIDNTNFRFLTTDLSLANTSSTVGFSDMIDHQLISNEWFSLYTANSCQVLPLQNHITSYSSTTSDHYPVFASYAYQLTSISNVPLFENIIYPNPLKSNDKITIENGELIGIYNMHGEHVNSTLFLDNVNYRQSGVYFIHLKIDGQIRNKRIIVQ